MASPSVGDEAGLDVSGLVEELLQRLVVTIEAVDIELAVVAHGDEAQRPVGEREVVERVVEVRVPVAADVLDHLAPRSVLALEDDGMPSRRRLGALEPLDRAAAVAGEREAERLGVAVRERD